MQWLITMALLYGFISLAMMIMLYRRGYGNKAWLAMVPIVNVLVLADLTGVRRSRAPHNPPEQELDQEQARNGKPIP